MPVYAFFCDLLHIISACFVCAAHGLGYEKPRRGRAGRGVLSLLRSRAPAHGAGRELVACAALGAVRRRFAAGCFQTLAGGVDAGEVLCLALARPFRAVRVVITGHGQPPQ